MLRMRLDLIKATLHAILTKIYIVDARFADNLITTILYAHSTPSGFKTSHQLLLEFCRQLNCM